MVNHSALIDLWEDINDDPAFDHLRTESIRLVPGIGANKPLVMVVGEAPGATENAQGQPFVGKAGRVLRDLMDIAGLSLMLPGNAWLTNVVKYRPPSNRTPTFMEMAHAKKYLKREWKLIGKPVVVVAVGGTALRVMAPKLGQRGVLATAGKCFPQKKVFVWSMIHPAYGLRNENAIPLIESHWWKLRKWLKVNGVVDGAQAN